MTDGVRSSGPILIVEDDAGVRGLLTELLEGAGYATRCAQTGEEGLALARAERPALVILDVSLSGLSGYEVCRALRDDLGERLAIMFVSGARTESFDRVAGLLVGADDYLPKPFAPDELLARVRALLRRSAAPAAAESLTRREREVLGLLAAGLERSEIARQLVISPKTVGTHVEHILGKLGVHTQAQAVARAYREGLVETPV